MRFHFSVWTNSGLSLNTSAMMNSTYTAASTVLTIVGIALLAVLCLPLIPFFLLTSYGIESSQAFE